MLRTAHCIHSIGCNGKVRGRGLCSLHYNREARAGRIYNYSARIFPIGSICVHTRKTANGRKSIRRTIKVASNKWCLYAKWLWEQTNGPVPPGMRVAHKDGDTMNDAPDNLILATADDILAMAQIKNPRAFDRGHILAGKTSIEAHHWRSIGFRMRNWVKRMFYPVDFEKRRIWNLPFIIKHDLYAKFVRMPRKRSPNVALSPVIGFPTLTLTEACVAACLSTNHVRTAQLAPAVTALRAKYGLEPFSNVVLWTAIGTLRQKGFIQPLGRARYALSEKGEAARQPPCPVIAVPGHELRDNPRFADFTRCDEKGRPVERAKAGTEAARLLEAMSRYGDGKDCHGPCAGCGDDATTWRRRGLCNTCWCRAKGKTPNGRVAS